VRRLIQLESVTKNPVAVHWSSAYFQSSADIIRWRNELEVPLRRHKCLNKPGVAGGAMLYNTHRVRVGRR
jgi:hypothetical protein